MTRIEALEELAAKVEAGEVKDWRPYYIERVFGTKRNAVLAVASFDGSLDAAKALHDAVLPGWKKQLYEEDDGSFNALLRDGQDDRVYAEVWSVDLARAWLLAILRALIEQEKAQ